MKSGSLNILEPSGPLQAYTGIALPVPFLSVINFTTENNRFKEARSFFYIKSGLFTDKMPYNSFK
jgi:hypothetical protein